MAQGNPARRQRFVQALLTCPTVRKAAKAAGVAERTARTWLADPAFKAELEAARRAAMEGAVRQLSGACSRAVATLRRLLKCGHPATEARAALGILDQATKADLQDVLRRLDEVEAAQRAGRGAT
jgi:phage terminase small subunit